MDLVVWNEGLVKWCLEHGAKVSDRAEDEDALRYPPLTELVAASGTVSIFKLLRANGAGRRTLHSAAGSAATCVNAADKAARILMLRLLVEEARLDVNRIDTDGQLPNHWGTPLAYAAKGKGGEDVVRYSLLAKGADPSVKNCWRNHDGISLAEFYSNEDVARVLRGVDDGRKEGLRPLAGRELATYERERESGVFSSHLTKNHIVIFPIASLFAKNKTTWSTPTHDAYMYFVRTSTIQSLTNAPVKKKKQSFGI